MIEAKSYSTFKNQNKPVYFKGFSPTQLLYTGLILGIVIVISIAFALYFLMIIIIPVLIISGKIKKENQNGNPDFVLGYRVKRKSPVYLKDTSHLLKKL